MKSGKGVLQNSSREKLVALEGFEPPRSNILKGRSPYFLRVPQKPPNPALDGPLIRIAEELSAAAVIKSAPFVASRYILKRARGQRQKPQSCAF